jgi:hypothetical protein
MDIDFSQDSQPAKFNDILVIQADQQTIISCTTTVYSFGTRILETKEIKEGKVFS